MARQSKPWLPPKEGGYRGKAAAKSVSKKTAAEGKVGRSRNTGGTWTSRTPSSGKYVEPRPPRGPSAVSPERKSESGK